MFYFRRHKVKHYPRYFFLLVTLGLNFSMVMSFVDRWLHGFHFQLAPELMQFGFLLFIDLYILPFLLLELNSIGFGEKELTLGALLWRVKVPYEDIQEFSCPPYWAFAVLRTRRCFYLINRRELGVFAELQALMAEKLASRVN